MTPHEIARAHRLRAQLGLPGGQLVANPIPSADEIRTDVIAPLIAQAQSEADAARHCRQIGHAVYARSDL